MLSIFISPLNEYVAGQAADSSQRRMRLLYFSLH